MPCLKSIMRLLTDNDAFAVQPRCVVWLARLCSCAKSALAPTPDACRGMFHARQTFQNKQ